MALAISGLPPRQRMEQLLASLEGVLAARVVLDDRGRPIEIHIMSPPDFHPKQVVRNVESALSAGLGIEIDRRVVSVARVADDTVLNGAAHDAAAHDAAPGADAPGADAATVAADRPTTRAAHHPARANGVRAAGHATARLVFTAFDARRDADGRIVCRVTLRRGADDFTGAGEGPDTPAGRADAGARATFAALALARQRDDIALEGVALVDLHGRTYVQVLAHASLGRAPVELTGTAVVDRSPDEAAVLASLQATNRWTESPV